jgi:hypothetical protein
MHYLSMHFLLTMIVSSICLQRTTAFWMGQNHGIRSTSSLQRKFSSRVSATQYTIEEPGVDPDVLYKTVAKHCKNLSLYKTEKPIAAHTQEAFSTLQEQLVGINTPLILDR